MKMKVFKRSLFCLMAVLLTLGIGMNVKAVAVTKRAEKTITYDENKYTGDQSNFKYTYVNIPVEAVYHHKTRELLKEEWNYLRYKDTRYYIDHGIYY